MPRRERHPGKPELFLLNRNTAFADVDFDAGGLLPLLIELIADDHRDDDERADHEVESVTIYDLMTPLGRESAAEFQLMVNTARNDRLYSLLQCEA